MKVLLCANDHEKITVGGPDVWMRRLANYLALNNIEISVCFFYYGNLEHCQNIQNLKQDGIAVECISNNKYPFTEGRLLEFLKIVKKLEPNIVIGNLCVPTFFASRYLKKLNIPVIPVIHANNTFYNGVIEEFVWKRGAFQITNLVTVSKFLRLLCLSKSRANVSVISCGTKTPSFKNTEPNGILKVVYIGRFRQWQKQIYDLTEAFCLASKQVPNAMFYLYGYGPNGEDERMHEIIATHNAEESVIIKGLIKNSKLQKEISNKHVVVLMSEYEGLPMALIEAMAVGLVPVCLSEESGVNEVVKHNKNGIIIKNRDQDFIDALMELNLDIKKWKLFSEASIKTIDSNYSNDVEGAKWLNFLNDIYVNQPRIKKPFVLPKKIRLPKKNEKINEDIRGPKPPSFFARLRKRVGLRTRIKKAVRF